jgi:hypothetical protein
MRVVAEEVVLIQPTGIALGTVTDAVGDIAWVSGPNRGSRTPRTHPLKQRKMVEAAGIESRLAIS